MSIPISDPDAEGDFDAWQELCEKSDRDSGDPDMCLITEEELREFMRLSFKGGLHQAAFILRSDASMAETSSILTKRVAHSSGDLFAAALLRSYANGLEMEADKLP